jgi:hypothetical protein
MTPLPGTLTGGAHPAAFPMTRHILAAAALLGLLAGCQDPAPSYYQAFGFQCADHHSRVADAMCNKTHDPGAAKVSRFCYKSLADTNCFDRPDPDQKNQPQGSPG